MTSKKSVDLPDTDSIEVGETAPDFTRPLVTRDYWEDVSLWSLVGDTPVLLVAYPMDGTGAAKGTWIEIRNRGWGGPRLSVVGISMSTPYEHMQLLAEHDLPYGLYSDPGADVAEAYGIIHDYDGMTGLVGHRPAMFLIDTSRTVRYAWIATRWPAERPVSEVARAIDALE